MTPRSFRPTTAGLLITLALLAVAVVATSPFWMFLLTSKPAKPLAKTVALLPIQGEIPPPERAALDRLYQEVVTRVARSGQVEAISLEKTKGFAADQRNLREIGSALSADLLVTGTAAVADEHLILNLYLVAPSMPSAPSWMNRSDLPRSGTPTQLEASIADEVTRAAVRALR